MPKKFFIKTWGCQMNVYDSGRMADVVAPLGYELGERVEDADLVIFNTCHIREKATEKLFSELGRLKPLQEAKAALGGRMMIAVAGCVAQAEGEEIHRRAPYVDLVFGPQSYHRLPEMIAQASREAGVVLDTDFPVEPKFDQLPQGETEASVSAFLSIQEGCDKFCAFCVVPYTRGAEYSRSVATIVEEAEGLARRGAREITLLGQNVNAFHGEGEDGEIWGLGRLLRRMAGIPGVKRLRYMTSHPLDVDDEMIAAHRDIPQVMPFLHLPVQSGSDAILLAMNRKHTAADYLKLVERLRKARPDLALSTDIIVGFPGETDQDFAATMALAREIGFAQSFSFKYSRRPGTPAAAMPNQIAEDVKDARLQELQSLLRGQQIRFNDAMVGRIAPVLFEDRGRQDGQIFGRTSFMQAVRVEASERLIGQEVDVVIEQASLNTLAGRLVIHGD